MCKNLHLSLYDYFNIVGETTNLSGVHKRAQHRTWDR